MSYIANHPYLTAAGVTTTVLGVSSALVGTSAYVAWSYWGEHVLRQMSTDFFESDTVTKASGLLSFFKNFVPQQNGETGEGNTPNDIWTRLHNQTQEFWIQGKDNFNELLDRANNRTQLLSRDIIKKSEDRFNELFDLANNRTQLFGQQAQTLLEDKLNKTHTDIKLSFEKNIHDIKTEIFKAIKKINIPKDLADKINEAFEDILDTLDLLDKAQRMGEEARDALLEFTSILKGGIREAIYNIAGEILKGVTFDLLPYILACLTAVTATPLTLLYLYKKAQYNIGRPKLATEIVQHTILTPLTERISNVSSSFFGFKTQSKTPVYNTEITRRIGELTRAAENIRNHGGIFPNVLFYGEGGTGKTLISELIAKNSGMSYVKMSGGDLAQYIKRGEHVTELNKLMDKMELSWRPWSSRPWILYIDEAESLCRDRSHIPTAELLELQNAFLNRTGTESKKFMLILSTNRMEDLDEAVLSRMDHKIYIGPPAESERARILKAYIPQFFSPSEQTAFFKSHQVQKIAQTTAGLTGRALFKLLNTLANKKATTDKCKLTQSLIDETVKDLILQEKEVARRRDLKLLTRTSNR